MVLGPGDREVQAHMRGLCQRQRWSVKSSSIDGESVRDWWARCDGERRVRKRARGGRGPERHLDRATKILEKEQGREPNERERDFDKTKGRERDFDKTKGRERDFDKTKGRERDFDKTKGRERDFDKTKGRERDFDKTKGRERHGESKMRERERERERERLRYIYIYIYIYMYIYIYIYRQLHKM